MTAPIGGHRPSRVDERYALKLAFGSRSPVMIQPPWSKTVLRCARRRGRRCRPRLPDLRPGERWPSSTRRAQRRGGDDRAAANHDVGDSHRRDPPRHARDPPGPGHPRRPEPRTRRNQLCHRCDPRRAAHPKPGSARSASRCAREISSTQSMCSCGGGRPAAARRPSVSAALAELEHIFLVGA